MKKLILVRHAKAVEPSVEINDSERSLKVKGIADAHKAAKKLQVFDIKPDLIISSTAFRALETSIIFAEELNYPKKKIKLSESLYFDYTTGDFAEMVQKQDDKYDTLLICAHNPKISEMAAHYTNEFNDELPACGIAVIDFSEKKWKNVSIREGKLSLFAFPDKENENINSDKVSKIKAKTKSKEKPKVKENPKHEIKIAAKPKVKADPKHEIKVTAKPKPKPKAKAKAKPEVKVSAKPEVKITTKPGIRKTK